MCGAREEPCHRDMRWGEDGCDSEKHVIEMPAYVNLLFRGHDEDHVSNIRLVQDLDFGKG